MVASRAAPMVLLVSLAVVALILEGCGSGGGPSSKDCTEEQKSQQCTVCSGGQCTQCRPNYILSVSPTTPCQAACLTNPENKSWPARPARVIDHSGIALPQLCINHTQPHFFGLGDWGGVMTGSGVTPWDNAEWKGRKFVKGIDDKAQELVATQMKLKAKTSQPDFVLNVGDSFYLGGIAEKCGSTAPQDSCNNGQFSAVYESIYDGPDLAGKPWFGVLGNHDYGGIYFDAGWDVLIYRSWCESVQNNRWKMPAPYYSQKVQYADFSIDMFFLDSNFQDATGGHSNHNICNGGACFGDCQVGLDDKTCVGYFQKLWSDSLAMLEEGMSKSTSEWQIVVTHFPGPSIANNPQFAAIAEKYGIDFVLTGHAHLQQFGTDQGTPWIITGGGGGISSDVSPSFSGDDDAYGFVDFRVDRKELVAEMYTHGDASGRPVMRTTHKIQPRSPSNTFKDGRRIVPYHSKALRNQSKIMV